MPSISILGSTGSIGCQSLEVIRRLGEDYRVIALTAGRNYRLLAEQARLFKPRLLVVSDEETAFLLKKEVSNLPLQVEWGTDALINAATLPDADQVMIAVVGFSGFRPTLAALKNKKRVALANKESLVVGGELISREMPFFREYILPVDSEHSALFQCLNGEDAKSVQRIILTASGGPFRTFDVASLSKVTSAMALNHPNWKMGPKITIDSATLMNKGFEVLEARWLFDLNLDKIDVLVHPQSLVHSLVEFHDGSVIAQIGAPDMRLPIQYAFTYPRRREISYERVSLLEKKLEFYAPDRAAFPCLEFAYQAGKAGGTMPACLNGANEVAVDLFLKGLISFPAIGMLIKKVMQLHDIITNPDEEDILSVDQWARGIVWQLYQEGDQI